MKKKLFSFVLAICLIVPCAFMFTGCGGNPAELTKADYIKAFNSVTDTYNQYLTNAQPASTQISDSDFIDANNNSQAQNMAKASLAMVYFLNNIYSNDTYTLKTAPEDCFVNDGHEIFDIRMSTEYNSNTSTIIAKLYADYRDSATLQYFVFEINYDFNTETLNNFSILGFSGTDTNKTTNNVRYYKFANNTLKVLDNTAESFEPFAQSILNEMDTLSAPEKAQNPAEYSTEYLLAMSEAMGQ